MATTTNLEIKLEIISKPKVAFDVQGFEGREYISKPYQYLIYATTSETFAPDTVLNERVKLTVTTACGTWVTSGIVMNIEERDPTPTELRVLVFTLSPRFAITQLTGENRVFGPAKEMSVDEIIKQEIKGAAISVPDSYNLEKYPKRKYVVQYNESDFTFISRLAEHVGIFYFFKQEASGETIVFGDKNTAFPKVDFNDKTGLVSAKSGDADDKAGGDGKKAEKNPSISYSHPKDANLPRAVDEAAVLSFCARGQAVSKTVALRDYNEVTPKIVSGTKDAGTATGFLGTIRNFGEHFADDNGGTLLATVRAQELAASRVVFVGETDAPELRAGMIFEIKGHPSFNGEYLITSVQHSASRPAPTGFKALPGAGRAYRNTITCIDANVEFRPARVTPRPQAMGLHTAKVDGATWNGRAEIDGEGRYKVQMMFPDGTYGKAKGSDYFRQIQPYYGPNKTGLYFPLVAGTEVLLGYINGDIDRPIIIGAASNPDPDWDNLVNDGSNVYNRIKSQSGTMVEIFDGPAAATTTTT